jgi:hypothetical protein
MILSDDPFDSPPGTNSKTGRSFRSRAARFAAEPLVSQQSGSFRSRAARFANERLASQTADPTCPQQISNRPIINAALLVAAKAINSPHPAAQRSPSRIE